MKSRWFDDIGVKIGYPKRCRVRSSFLLLERQVCSPAAEALEGIRYPRVAAVTVLPLVLCSLGGECRRVRLVLGLLMMMMMMMMMTMTMMMMMMMMMSNQLMTKLVFLGCIPSILKVFGWFSRWRSIPRYTNQIDITPSAFKEQGTAKAGRMCQKIPGVPFSRSI